MKKSILVLAFMMIAGTLCAQQQVAEPEFIGEAVVVNADGESQLLEKETVMLRTRVNAGAILVGIGKAKTLIMIDGVKAATQLKAADEFNFIIKAVDNKTDPMSIIQIFRFGANKKQRLWFDQIQQTRISAVHGEEIRREFVPDYAQREAGRRVRNHRPQP